MNIETKANIGDTIFFLKKINRKTCPVCTGTGKICIGTAINPNFDSPDKFVKSIGGQLEQNLNQILTGDVREYACPECNGKGTVKITGWPKYEVGSGVVVSIETSMNANSNIVVYRVNDITARTNRTLTDDKMYLDQEIAEKECRFMNLERRMVPLECVHIPPCFAAKIPCNEKLMNRLDEWRSQRKFKTEIYVDEKLNLFDGYTSFLMYRMLGIFDIPVVICPTGMKM